MSPALAGGFFTIEPPGKPEDKCMKGVKGSNYGKIDTSYRIFFL